MHTIKLRHLTYNNRCPTMFCLRTTIVYYLYKRFFHGASHLFNFVMYADDTTLSTSLNSLSKTTLDNKSTETIVNEELCKIN